MKSKNTIRLMQVGSLIFLGFIELFTYHFWQDIGLDKYLIPFVFNLLINFLFVIFLVSSFKLKVEQRLIARIIDDLDRDDIILSPIEDEYLCKKSLIVQSFNGFITSLGGKAKAIRQEATRFVAYAGDLSDVSVKLTESSGTQERAMGETNNTLKDMAASVKTIGNEMVSLYTAIEAEEEAVHALNNSVSTVRGRLEDLSMQTNDNVLSISTGRNQVINLESKINQLTLKMQAIDQAMKSFKDTTSKIASILHVINEIAERTHLLATNAAIEAARAGGIGKGFSVVATEIRRLADSSTSSIDEVDQTITETLDTLDDAVVAVREGHFIVEDFVQSTGEVSKLFGQFENFANIIRDDIQSVDDATKILNNAGNVVQENSDTVKKFTASFQQNIQVQTKRYTEISAALDSVTQNAVSFSNMATQISELAGFLRGGSMGLEKAMNALNYNSVLANDLNKRSEERTSAIYRLEVIEDMTEFPVGYLDDYSYSGLSIVSNEDFSVDQKLNLRILLTSALKKEHSFHDIKVSVIVRRIKPHQGEQGDDQSRAQRIGYGCEIISIDDESRKIMQFLIDNDHKIEQSAESDLKLIKEQDAKVRENSPFQRPVNLEEKNSEVLNNVSHDNETETDEDIILF